MLVIILSTIAWIILVVYALKTVIKYKKSSKEKKKQSHGLMIRVVGLVPLSAILITGENLKLQGFTMEEIKPYLFIAAIIFIFIPGYIYLMYTLFSKETRKDYNDPDKYKAKFLYNHRKFLVPIIVTVPIVIITITVYKLGDLAF